MIQIKWVIFRNTYVCSYVHVKTVSKHRGLGFEGEQTDIGKGSQPSLIIKFCFLFIIVNILLKIKTSKIWMLENWIVMNSAHSEQPRVQPRDWSTSHWESRKKRGSVDVHLILLQRLFRLLSCPHELQYGRQPWSWGCTGNVFYRRQWLFIADNLQSSVMPNLPEHSSRC